jgi:hypothetical protein
LKWVLSVSLGDPSRDHRVETEMLGERVVVERRGTGGDLRAAVRLIRAHDGAVSAFGLGGVNLHYIVGDRKYRMPDGWRLREAAEISPVADGAMVKRHIEPRIIDALAENGVQLRGSRAAISSALDRWHLATALESAGCRVLVCDAASALRLPVVFDGTSTFARAARAAMPWLRFLPVRLIYPGRTARATGPRPAPWPARRIGAAGRAFAGADIIAGDTHLMWSALPADLAGKVVIVSTATESEIRELKARGAALVAGTCPSLGGRSFGANVTEALIAAFDGRPPEDIPAACYVEWWNRLGLRFRLEKSAGTIQ